MNISFKLINNEKMSPARKTLALIPAIINALVTINASAADIQHSGLFEPSAYQLRAEMKGRVMIYDRLENGVVEQALDDQFERIENMMFVRTRYVSADGSIQQEEDCD